MPAVRSFFQMSVEKSEAPAGGFRWKINGAALADSALLRGEGFDLLEGRYPGPALFVAGGASGFITPADHPLIRARFPAALIQSIPGADHWLHHSAAEAFRERVEAFLRSL